MNPAAPNLAHPHYLFSKPMSLNTSPRAQLTHAIETDVGSSDSCCMQLELNVMSAQGLKKKRFGGKIHAYVVACVRPEVRLATGTDTSGDDNPSWNCTLTFELENHLLNQDQTSGVMFEVYDRGSLGDTLLGTAGVLLSSLARRGKGYEGAQFSALQIRRPSGRAQGILNIGSMILDKLPASTIQPPPPPLHCKGMAKQDDNDTGCI